MRSGNFVEETTTSIAGTNGNGAVTMTAVTGKPRFSTVLGSQATTVRYVIERVTDGAFEVGIGSVSSNVLTRTRPQITWDGTSTYDDSTPSPIAFGSTPTSGDVLIRMAATAEAMAPVIPGFNQTVTSGLDSTWREYPIANHARQSNGGTTSDALTANREYYGCYRLDTAGLLTGIQYDVTGAVASSNIKVALYPCASNGLPGQKIVDFVTTATATTGVKTDTATGSWSPAGPVWLTPGWYYIGYITNGAITLRGLDFRTYGTSRTPIGWTGGYGDGNMIYIAGNYTTGLPALPNLSGGTVQSPVNPQSLNWFGLKVTA